MLIQINNLFVSEPDFGLNLIIRANSANRPYDHNVDEVCSNQSMVTEKIDFEKCQSQSQTILVSSNANINNTENTEIIPQIEGTEISP